MKHEWRKKEKELYLPKQKPMRIEVPAFKYLCIEGTGNPNSEAFADYIAALYALSYGIKMSHKKGLAPVAYYDYTVYPLEGVWDITDEAKKKGSWEKDDLVFKLMIRQPDFVDSAFVETIRALTLKKKGVKLVDKVQFETLEEGSCIQMLHVGPYDNEPVTFQLMEEFATAQGWQRKSKIHKEIYLSDARRTAPERLQTVLRFLLI